MDQNEFVIWHKNLVALGEENVEAAIQEANRNKDHSLFYPWSAHILMAYYQKLGRDAEAFYVAVEISKKCPEFSPSWWPQLLLTRGTAYYKCICRNIIDRFQTETYEISDYMLPAVIEASLTERPADLGSILSRFERKNLISHYDIAAAKRAVEFLNCLSDEIRTIEGRNDISYWQFVLNRGCSAGIFQADNNIGRINLSALGVDRLEGWNNRLAHSLIIAIGTLMDWRPFSFRKFVTEADHFAEEFWKLLDKPLYWLPLTRIDDKGVATRISPPPREESGMDGQERHKVFSAWVEEEYRVFFRRATAAVNFNGISGAYCEFGCHGGLTFRLMYEALTSMVLGSDQDRSRHMWGFDSFAGLPESEDPRDFHQMWGAGTYRTTKERFLAICARAQIPPEQFTIVEGFYHHSLFNAADARLASLRDIAIAYIDCDMYTSTKDVLRFLAPRLKNGMLLCFDDYYCASTSSPSGERLAFLEFAEEHAAKFGFEEYFRYHFAGASFIVEKR